MAWMAGPLLALGVLALAAISGVAAVRPPLSKERMVFQLEAGDIHMAFYPTVAPKTVEHIRRLGELGAYNTNHFFRVDAGFVAQTADCRSGRTLPLNAAQGREEDKRVPLEVRPDVKHDRRGVLSMARHSDPMSGGSSFSVLLNAAPHLDMEYTVFGEVTHGLETLAALEGLETRKEGIFVMPLQRITIESTYMYMVDEPLGGPLAPLLCAEQLAALQARFDAQAVAVQAERQQHLP